MDAVQRQALRSLVPVARDALADLEPADVPNRLNKVAKSSARTLPPPLERSLLVEIETNEKLRDHVRERWMQEGRTEPLVDSFLSDPQSIADEVHSLEAALEVAAIREALSDANRRVAALEAELEEAKRRTADARAAHADEIAEAKRADKRARAGLEAEAARAQAAEAAALNQVAAKDAELETLVADLADARTALKRAKETAWPETKKAPESLDVRTDAAGLAAQLDALERKLRPFRHAEPIEHPEEEWSAGALPPGIGPEAPEAVDAMLDTPGRIVVDGYNLAAALVFDAFSTADGRESAIQATERLARRTDNSTTVVFDAALVDGRQSFTTESGVRIVFTKGETADDHIVSIARQSSEPVFVISNDRELGERASSHGAVTVWTDALMAWLDL